MKNRKQQQQQHNSTPSRNKKRRRMHKQDTNHLWLLGAAIVCLYSFLGYQYYQHYYCSAFPSLQQQQEEDYDPSAYRPLCLQISSNFTYPIQPRARVLILMGTTNNHTDTLLEAIPIHQFEAILLFGFDNNNNSPPSHVFSLKTDSRLLLDNTLFVGSSLSSQEQELETLVDTLDMLEDGQRVVILSPQMPLLSSELIHVLSLNQDILSLWIYAESTEPIQRVEQGITFLSNPVRDTLFCL